MNDFDNGGIITLTQAIYEYINEEKEDSEPTKNCQKDSPDERNVIE